MSARSNPSITQPEPILAEDQPARKQLQSIQVLRGVAALVVVAFHLTQVVYDKYRESLWFDVFERGFAGVDLFFVISGFVIVYTSQAYIGQPGTLRSYLTKRAIRVYPVYWLSILAITVMTAGVLVLGPDHMSEKIAHRWPGLDTLLLTPQHRATNIVSWSLSHELFFYLLFACLILSRKLWVVPAFFLSGAVVMAFSRQEFINDHTSSIWAYFWFNPLNAEFALGALVGYGFTHHAASRREGIGAALLALLWLYAFGDTPNEFFSERLFHYGVVSMLLLIAVLTYEYLQHPRFPKWLIQIGDASYLLYLIHTPLFVPFTRLIVRVIPVYSAFTVPLACLAFVGLVTYGSIVIHRLIEKPLTRYLAARFLPSRTASRVPS